MKNIKYIIVFVVISYSGLFAQEYHFGIRGGTNFGKILGTAEEGVDETYTFNNGFHFGVEALYSFNDYFSIGTEISYNQIGSGYHYQGQSYHIFVEETSLENNNLILMNDNVKYDLNISNSYINIPLNIYVKPFKKLEFKLGGYIGFLINPSASGKMSFGSKFNQVLKYNYYSDKTPPIYGYSGGYLNVINPNDPDGLSIITRKIADAYYQYPASDYDGESFYNLMDGGLNAGINYYFNSSLYLGVNLQYGLMDITNNKLDRSLKTLVDDGDMIFNNDDHLIYREDKDTNLNIQFSLGFRF